MNLNDAPRSLSHFNDWQRELAIHTPSNVVVEQQEAIMLKMQRSLCATKKTAQQN